MYITQWNEKIHSSTDGIMYRAFKLTPQYSSYFNVIKVSKYRQAMVRFITKNNNIPVVSGKWQRPRPYHQRLCEECELLGDEYHFLFLCKRLKALRSKYISRYFWTKPSMNKFIELLSSEHSKTINNLAIFVYSGLKVFANLKKKKKTVIICRCFLLLYRNISLSPRSYTAHIVYISLYYVFAHRPMGLC